MSSAHSEPAVALDRVSKVFNRGRSNEVHALADVYAPVSGTATVLESEYLPPTPPLPRLEIRR